MPENWQEAGFGLYLHWPFCAAKCPYCDFNSHLASHIDHDAWLSAYIEELDRAANLTPDRVLQTIFFGGGTPSLMEPRVVDEILNHVAKRWTVANDIEITLEANPTSVDAQNFQSMADAGVNRVSVGVQALVDEDLRSLGRLHSADEARKAIETAQNIFDRMSFDLIYARQHQTLAQWEEELKAALTLGSSHLSLYQLTIEDGTAFGDRHRRGSLQGLPNDDQGADMYQLTQEICLEAGLLRYEVSNHARPGEEARHNLIYWKGGDYLGVGPGAHGRLWIDGTRYATEQSRMPNIWLRGERSHVREALDSTEIAEEMILMGLRLRTGLDLDRLTRWTGYEIQNLRDLQEEGWIRVENRHLIVNEHATLLLNAIIERLIDQRNSV